MINQFTRTELVIGKDAIEKLHNSCVAVFGLGGVGSFVVEGLVRAGVGKFILIDNDDVDITNLNRQIHATHNTIGKYKVDLMEQRILEINPDAIVKKYRTFYMPENKEDILENHIDYIVDAIDTVTAKIEIAVDATRLNIPALAAMGTGNKLDPTKFEITDISKTKMCPLAKVMRKKLKEKGIKKYKVLYSTEEPSVPDQELEKECVKGTNKKQVPGSVSFVPSVAGLIIAGQVIKDLIKGNEKNEK